MDDEILDTAPPPAPEPEREPLDLTLVKRVLEAALLSTPEPLTLQQLKRLFGGELDVDSLRKILDELKEEWADRAVELTAVASGWRFRVRPDYQRFLDRISNEKAPRYSRAVLETLAIIAYRQPVTRGDIEDIRGVAVSPPTLKALEERGWIDVVGHRESPGRPALFATTRKFLDDLNLRSIEELPALEELQSTLDSSPGFAPLPQQEPLLDADGEARGPEAEEEAASQTPQDIPTADDAPAAIAQAPQDTPNADDAPSAIAEAEAPAEPAAHPAAAPEAHTSEAGAAAPSQDTEHPDHAG